VLKAGESFGELALLKGKNAPRAATIISKENTHLAYLERDDFLLILSIKIKSIYIKLLLFI